MIIFGKDVGIILASKPVLAAHPTYQVSSKLLSPKDSAGSWCSGMEEVAYEKQVKALSSLSKSH